MTETRNSGGAVDRKVMAPPPKSVPAPPAAGEPALRRSTLIPENRRPVTPAASSDATVTAVPAFTPSYERPPASQFMPVEPVPVPADVSAIPGATDAPDPEPAASAAVPVRPKRSKMPANFKGIHFSVPEDLRDRARAAYRWTNAQEDDDSFEGMLRNLLEKECERRESLYNNGERFPGGDKPLR